MIGIEEAKRRLLQSLAGSSYWRALWLGDFVAAWRLAFEDLKDAVILLHEERCIGLRKWDGKRWVEYEPKLEAWFFYQSNFEARTLARGRALAQEVSANASDGTSPIRTVKRIHFEDFSGHDFERLVFAYLLRTDHWMSLEWYGEVGSDLGRDIWGVLDDGREGTSVCVQCANRRELSFAKVSADIAKILRAPRGKPEKFMLVTSGNPSAGLRDRLKGLLGRSGIQKLDIWGAVEFEERLRANAHALLERFVQGKTFPDEPVGIAGVLAQIGSKSDAEALAQMARLFDRPAFYTPFVAESSIPAFEQAITDTIEAIGTGVYKLRDGTLIRRLPSRHDIGDAAVRESLAKIEHLLCDLREAFQNFSRSGDIRPCGCNKKDCWVYFISNEAAQHMDALRSQILQAFHRLHPAFVAHMCR